MDNYLLLRSNKKMGPYSLDQLLNLGFKPYDLVWIEGKSAAWRYPSEVDALKEYAKPVEEQPYDRFYKKPAEEKPTPTPQPRQEETRRQKEIPVETSSAPKLQPVYEAIKQEPVIEVPVEAKPIMTTKKVFVSMPENHVPQKQVQPEARYIQPEPKFVQPEPVKAPTYFEERKPELKPIIEERKFVVEQKKPVIIDDEPTLNEKYSESLDDIKRRYAETYLNRQKKPRWTSTHSSLLQIFGGAIFFCILVVVAYKNFAEEDNSNKERLTVIQPKNTNNTATNPAITVSTTPVETKTPSISKQDTKTNNTGKQNSQPVVETNEDLRQESNEAALADVKPERKAVMPPPSETKTEEEVKTKARPVNINRLVSVKANNYKQRAFGGVLNLELTVDNESKFELDRVIVELQYLKPSEQPLKTDRIIFNAVAPGGSQTLKIPDYLRGIKVSYRILEIESSQYETYTAGL